MPAVAPVVTHQDTMALFEYRAVARLLLLTGPLLTGCGGGDGSSVKALPDAAYTDPNGGVPMVAGRGKTNSQQEAGASLQVNKYLWRGALETLAFMPLASADPFGGVIVTDWYSPAGTPAERFKATAYVLGRELRTDGLKLTIFRQVRDGGQWEDAPVNPATTADIERQDTGPRQGAARAAAPSSAAPSLPGSRCR